jgi:hypothetical protein
MELQFIILETAGKNNALRLIDHDIHRLRFETKF